MPARTPQPPRLRVAALALASGLLAGACRSGPEARPAPRALSDEEAAALAPVTLDPKIALAQLEGDLAKSIPHWPEGKQKTSPDLVKARVRTCVHPEGFSYRTTLIDSTGDAAFDASLTEAVRGLRYQPYVRDGVPLPFCYMFTYVHAAAEPATRPTEAPASLSH
jgi:hypothetical protein